MTPTFQEWDCYRERTSIASGSCLPRVKPGSQPSSIVSKLWEKLVTSQRGPLHSETADTFQHLESGLSACQVFSWRHGPSSPNIKCPGVCRIFSLLLSVGRMSYRLGSACTGNSCPCPASPEGPTRARISSLTVNSR